MFERTEDEANELVKSWITKYGIFVLLLIVIVIAGLWFFLSHQEKKTVENLNEQKIYNIIQTDIQAGKIADAKKNFERFSSDSSYQSIAALALANYYHDKDNTEEMEKYLGISLKSNDLVVKQTAEYASLQMLLAEGKLDEAMKKVLDLEGSAYDLELPMIKGDILFEQGKLKEALGAYESSLYVNSSLLQRKITLVKAKLALGDSNKAGSSTEENEL